MRRPLKDIRLKSELNLFFFKRPIVKTPIITARYTDISRTIKILNLNPATQKLCKTY